MGILVFFGGLVWHAYRLYQEENGKRIALEHQAASPLRIVFDELRHKYEELPHKQAIIARVSVVNEGPDTIGNVALKIVKIEGKTNKHSELLKALVGVKLSISDNPTGPIVQPMEAPKDTAILHPKDSVTFDIDRVCKRPGNHQILHASVFRRHPEKYPNHYSRRPDDVLPPGKYSLTIATSGDNLQPTEATFEFSGTTRRVTFRKISD